MKGIRYIINDKGEKTDLVISLKEHRQIVMDFLDVMTVQKRRNEDTVPFEDFINQIKENDSEGSEKKPLKFGMMKGTFLMADDFDAPLDDFEDY
jgi:hypothetical protein